jgi:hypothetical protein
MVSDLNAAKLKLALTWRVLRGYSKDRLSGSWPFRRCIAVGQEEGSALRERRAFLLFEREFAYSTGNLPD